jgi:hypothetical protein
MLYECDKMERAWLASIETPSEESRALYDDVSQVDVTVKMWKDANHLSGYRQSSTPKTSVGKCLPSSYVSLVWYINVASSATSSLPGVVETIVSTDSSAPKTGSRMIFCIGVSHVWATTNIVLLPWIPP